MPLKYKSTCSFIFSEMTSGFFLIRTNHCRFSWQRTAATRIQQAATYLARGVLFISAATGLFFAQIWGIQCWAKLLLQFYWEASLKT